MMSRWRSLPCRMAMSTDHVTTFWYWRCLGMMLLTSPGGASPPPSRRRWREGGLDRPTEVSQRNRGRAKSQTFLAFGKATFWVGVSGRERRAGPDTPTPTTKNLSRVLVSDVRSELDALSPWS